MATLKEHWQDLPLWAKALVVGGASYGAYKLLSNDNSGGTTDFIPGATNLSYPAHQYDTYADMFEAAWLSGPFGATEDDSSMADILMAMNTTGDVIALNNSFGTRHIYGMPFLSGGNLSQIVSKYLDQGDKDDVNENYAMKAIDWQWL